MIKLTKLSLRNYRGIKQIDADVSGAGFLAKGGNGKGKTTVIGAIGAALAASDIGPDAIHIGEDDGEILIDLDAAGKALHVRRKFGQGGSTLSITNQEGDKKAKPAALLAELVGSAPLDVVSVVLEKDKKKRRETILKALDVTVTVEQLRRWIPALPDNTDVRGHGLEVIERLRLRAYDSRTAANRTAKEADEALGRAESLAKANRGVVPAGAPAFDVAKAAAEKTTAALNEARSRLALAKTAEERSAGLRQQVADWRAEAAFLEERAETGPSESMAKSAFTEWEDAASIVRELEAKLVSARARLEKATDRKAELDKQLADAEAAAKRAAELVSQADKTEAGIAAAADSITEEDVKAAEAADSAALSLLFAAGQRAKAEDAEAARDAAREAAAAAQKEADRLDAVVKKLTVDAPAAILAETPGMPAGIALDGDEVKLDGVSLDRLCGAEQMVLAANIAKRLNPNVGFLVVDGLERLDPEQLEAFVASATADGRQLFGSIVDRGELVLAAIETDTAAATAAE
jgi:DNA repair exonuclease SbcCD ATPase subunit